MEISITPRFLIRKITDDNIQQINWNILISSSLILFIVLFINMSFINSIPHFCLFHRLTGLPCPGCGMIRSILYLGDLRLIDSLKTNPNGLLITIAFILQLPLRIIALTNETYSLTIEKISQIMTRLIIASLLIYWFYHIINLNF